MLERLIGSPYLMNLFLQGFDEGWITDGRGKKVYLSDAIVIMTSNLGSDSFKKYEKPLGFGTKTLGDVKAIKNDVMKAAEQRFSPEFRNRVTVNAYAAQGNVLAKLRVTNPQGNSAVTTVPVTAGIPPVPVIVSPAATTTWAGSEGPDPPGTSGSRQIGAGAWMP